ncbi:MAG: transglycosylase SLT domain-containing protein [Gammaproteobacteria bacterium]|nr:transglycosylase SLT domain-containing protein [Gammaproteobacteria bacterium]
MKYLISLFYLTTLFAAPVAAQIKQPLPAAYSKFAVNSGVPPHLLYAVAATESSRAGYAHPWPWTANIAGKAYYFNSRPELYKKLYRYLKSGKNNFDVGLMQINWRFNSALFAKNLWRATDPYHNLAAGAGHLGHLYKKHGNWKAAVAYYHVGHQATTKQTTRAKRYQSRVWTHLMRISRRFS